MRWLSTASTANPAHAAAPRCSAPATPPTKPTTAPRARPAESCSPTAPSRASSAKTGPAPWKSWKRSKAGRPILAAAGCKPVQFSVAVFAAHFSQPDPLNRSEDRNAQLRAAFRRHHYSPDVVRQKLQVELVMAAQS